MSWKTLTMFVHVVLVVGGSFVADFSESTSYSVELTTPG